MYHQLNNISNTTLRILNVSHKSSSPQKPYLILVSHNLSHKGILYGQCPYEVHFNILRLHNYMNERSLFHSGKFDSRILKYDLTLHLGKLVVFLCRWCQVLSKIMYIKDLFKPIFIRVKFREVGDLPPLKPTSLNVGRFTEFCVESNNYTLFLVKVRDFKTLVWIDI